MTPKEKAEKLVDSFIDLKTTKLSDYSRIYYPTAKQCALIAVDEILNIYIDFPKHPQSIYWQEVKNEINLL